jgi:ribulose-phosphate 3-epimerase
MNKKIIISPSVLSADFIDFKSGIELIENAGAEAVHLDVMDGHFVPNLTFGAPMIKAVRKVTDKILDVHLMVENPEKLIDDYIDAGADMLTFHAEASIHSHRLIQYIQSKGIKAGVSIVPGTPVSAITPLLRSVDLILIMTVNPGFGGQKMIPECVAKIKELDQLRTANGYKYLINVDGGVNSETVNLVREAGVDIIVAGSAFFNSENPSQLVKEFKS